MSEDTEIVLSHTVERDNLALEEGYTLIKATKDDEGREVRVFYKGELNIGLSIDLIKSIDKNVGRIRSLLEGKHTEKNSVDKIMNEFIEGDKSE